jgi:hypothetical protein
MKLVTSGVAGRDNCLIYAASMVLEVEPAALVSLIGHDGSRTPWASCPSLKVGVHPQEIIDASIMLNKPLVYIEVGPAVKHDDKVELKEVPIFSDSQVFGRIMSYTDNHDAIIIGRYRDQVVKHAVAWDHKEGLVYDPNGTISFWGDFVSRFILSSLLLRIVS